MAESIRSGLPVQGMRSEVARRRIETFRQRFKEPHFYFAQHAAFPLALTPDLLYRLWANFQRNIRDEQLMVPWIAVADLLLSPLCEEVDVGYELYEMDVTIRALLLNDLQANPRFGKRRIDELSSFLQDYARQQLKSSDPALLDTARGQRWTALAYTRPGEAAHELAEALIVLHKNNGMEQVRIASLMETLGILAEPFAALEGFAPLLTYAQGIANSVMGDEDIAQTQTSFTKETELVERALGVRLPTLEQMQQAREARKDFFISYHQADQDWSKWIGWQLEEAGYDIVLQEWSFQPGSDFEREIDTILQGAKRIIIVLSPDYLNEFTDMTSWGSALLQDVRTKDERRTLIAMQVRECVEELKNLLGNFVYTDFVGVSEQEARETLLQDVDVSDTDRDVLVSTPSTVQRARVIAEKPLFPGQRGKVSEFSPISFVFLSYARADSAFAARLEADLRTYGITTWADRGMIAGETDWEETTREAIKAARAVLLIASPESRSSSFVRHELDIAKMCARTIYPILVAGSDWADVTPIEMLRHQYIDARGSRYETAFREIITSLLIETVKVHMQPPPRAMATANTLQQLSIFIPNDVTLADLVVGWRTLSHSSQQEEEPATSQRRVTCSELATMASQFTTGQGNLAQAIKTWQIWLDAFKNSGDPRQAAMARTFARELAELQEATHSLRLPPQSKLAAPSSHQRPVPSQVLLDSKLRIFISHSTTDNDFGLKLTRDLRQFFGNDNAVWFDASSGLLGVDRWWEKIRQEVEERDVFIVILSPDAMDSAWVRTEIDMALSKGKRIIPLLYRRCEIRGELRAIQYISFLPPKEYEFAFDELLFALEAAAQSAGTSRSETAEQ